MSTCVVHKSARPPTDHRHLSGNINTVPAALVGGFSEEAEIPGIKYVLSPYTLNLVATPLFLKPGIPFSIKVGRVEGGREDRKPFQRLSDLKPDGIILANRSRLRIHLSSW